MNPLKKLHQEMTIQQMSELTGLHVNTLSDIMRFKEKNILQMRLETILLLRDKLNVDMLEVVKNYSFESAND